MIKKILFSIVMILNLINIIISNQANVKTICALIALCGVIDTIYTYKKIKGD